MMKRFLFTIIFNSIIGTTPVSANTTKMGDLIHGWLQKDKYLVLSGPIKLDTLDPKLSIGAHSKYVLPLIFEPLISLNSNQELKPILAKSWEFSSDKKSIIITLYPNHHFSDNTEVTAQDVVNSFYRLCSPGSQESGQISGLVGCQEHAHGSKIILQISAMSRYKVKCNINCSPTTFLSQLSSPSNVITKQIQSKLVGSGPYIVQEKKDNFIILSKNPYYSGNIHVQNQGIIIFYVSGNELATMIKTYQYDGALMYRIEEISNFSDPNFSLIRSNPNITEILVFNNKRFPFNKKVVRKAISADFYNHFIDSRIPGAHKAYGIIPNGIGGSISNIHPITLPQISPEEVFHQVPELKNKRVAVTLHQLIDVKNEYVTQQLVQTANKYNIDIRFKYHRDYSDLIPLYFNHNLDGCVDLYIFNREANHILEFFTKNGENDANIDDDHIDALLKEALNSPSFHGRFLIYRKLAQYIQDESILLPIFYMDHGNILSKKLSGISEDFIFNPFLELPRISKK